MTEHSGERINHATVALPESTDLDAAYDSLERLKKPPPIGGPPTPGIVKSIEEVQPQGNAALLDAIAKVYALATRQIAYHEREAARLREALKPFATMAPPRQPAAPESIPLEDGVRQLLALADRLGIEGEQGK